MTMILSCQGITKAFQEQFILSNCSFHIEDYDKAAIVGVNGAGKSTLLKIIVGELTADTGTVALARDKNLGYLPQYQETSSENTIYEELLSVKQTIIDTEHRMRSLELQMKALTGEALQHAMEEYARLTHFFESENGYAYQSEVAGILKGLGFSEEDFPKKISTLSGGQKTRVALGRILLQKPDLILLDEPTNHLDMSSITWLETYLSNYRGAVLIVSHDRYFLDRITNKILEIDHGKMTTFQGNYSDYAQKKELLRNAEMNAYLNQQTEIKHQEEVIQKLKSFNREKSIKRAESREKMLDKITLLEKPPETEKQMQLRIEPRKRSGNDVLTVEDIEKSFGSVSLFSNLSFQLKRGEHVAIIGNNGTGKTTILKIINKLLPADSGSFQIGANVTIGYYDQEHHVLHEEKNLFEEISDDYPTLTNTQIRSTLAAFLFTGEDVLKRISALSGGERGRISLAKLMLSEANFLILDEPTNHLDMASKEILEHALNHYTGTVLYVSHDRYFINKTASRILDLSNRTLTCYLGNYDYYLEKKRQNDAATLETAKETSLEESSTKNDWKQQKEQQALMRKRENELKKTEEKIDALEERNRAVDMEMAEPSAAANVPLLQSLSLEKAEIQKKLELLYQQWEDLSNFTEGCPAPPELP